MTASLAREAQQHRRPPICSAQDAEGLSVCQLHDTGVELNYHNHGNSFGTSPKYRRVFEPFRICGKLSSRCDHELFSLELSAEPSDCDSAPATSAEQIHNPTQRFDMAELSVGPSNSAIRTSPSCWIEARADLKRIRSIRYPNVSHSTPAISTAAPIHFSTSKLTSQRATEATRHTLARTVASGNAPICNCRFIVASSGSVSCQQYRRWQPSRRVKPPERPFGTPNNRSVQFLETLRGCFGPQKQRLMSHPSPDAASAPPKCISQATANGQATPSRRSSLKSCVGIQCEISESPNGGSCVHKAKGEAKIDVNRVLDMWVTDTPIQDIMREVGALNPNTVTKIVSLARAKRDPRAVSRKHWGGMAAKAQQREVMLRVRRNRMVARFPATVADLNAALARYSGPVTKLQAGFHTGYVPTCLRAIDY